MVAASVIFILVVVVSLFFVIRKLNSSYTKSTPTPPPTGKNRIDSKLKKLEDEMGLFGKSAGANVYKQMADEKAKRNEIAKQLYGQQALDPNEIRKLLGDFTDLKDRVDEKFAQPAIYESKDELVAEISKLEDELIDLESNYNIIAADAEVTGNDTELKTADKLYGALEESIQVLRDKVSTIEANDTDGDGYDDRSQSRSDSYYNPY